MAKQTQPKRINRFKNRFDPERGRKEQNSGEFLTKPNQTKPIREILMRNTNGMSYDNFKTPFYEEQATFSSQDLHKIQDMEPMEKLRYLADLKKDATDLENKIKSFEEERKEQELERQQMQKDPPQDQDPPQDYKRKKE